MSERIRAYVSTMSSMLDIIKVRPWRRWQPRSTQPPRLIFYSPTFSNLISPIPQHTHSNTMATGNESDDEGPGAPPPSPPAPMSRRHYDSIMAAIQRLENAPHPLAAIASIDVRLRDPASITWGAIHTMGVSVVPLTSGQLFDTSAANSPDAWARWAASIDSGLRGQRLDSIRQGFELAREEDEAEVARKQAEKDEEAKKKGGWDRAATVAALREFAETFLMLSPAQVDLLAAVAMQDGDARGREDQEQVVASGSGGDGRTGKSGGDGNGSGAGDGGRNTDNGTEQERRERGRPTQRPNEQQSLGVHRSASEEWFYNALNSQPNQPANHQGVDPQESSSRPSTQPTKKTKSAISQQLVNPAHSQANPHPSNSAGSVNRPSSNSDSSRQPAIHSNASQAAKKLMAQASGSSKEQSTPTAGTAGSMGPPPPPSSSRSQGNRRSRPGSESKTAAPPLPAAPKGRGKRAASETATSAAPKGRGNRAVSETPTSAPLDAATTTPRRRTVAAIPATDRSLRQRSGTPLPVTAEEEEEEEVDERPYFDSKGAKSSKYVMSDKEPPMKEEDINDKIRRMKREQRLERAAPISAAAKRPASTAGVDSPSERPAKRARHQDEVDNSEVDQTVQEDDEPSLLLSAIDEAGESLTDEKSDAHSNDESADPEEVDSEAVESQDEDSEESRRQVYTALIMNDLAEREGKSVTYRDLLEKLARDFKGDEVYDEDFRKAVDDLVDEGLVQSDGEGERELLWIGVDSPAADGDSGDEDGGDGNDDNINFKKRDDGERDSTGESSSDSSSEDEDGGDTSDMQLSQRELNDKVRREGLERAILHDLGRRGTGDVDLNVLKKRLERNPHGEKVIEEAFSSAIEKLEELGQVRSSGAGPKRRVRLGAAATPTGGSAAADGNDGDDDKNTSGNSDDDNDSAKVDGLEAQNRDEAHHMKPRSRVEKPGNSRQPNRSIVDRIEEDETSWVSPEQNANAKRGSSQRHRQPEASPSKLPRKRKAKTEDPALAEEAWSLSPLSPDAPDANFDPDDEDDGQPPSKKAKQSAQKKPARGKE
jgi:hypothetical protein